MRCRDSKEIPDPVHLRDWEMEYRSLPRSETGTLLIPVICIFAPQSFMDSNEEGRRP